jgi:uncharacterized repeat protein (TIGR02543 family)
MKSTFFNAASRRFAAIVAVIAAIGFTTAACDNGSPASPPPATFTVTFETGVAGEAGRWTVTVRDGLTVDEPENEPEWAGHDFTGWFEGAQPFNFDTPITRNITLTAGWGVIYLTVTFDANGGTEVPYIPGVAHGSTVGAPAPPTRAFSPVGLWEGTPPATGTVTFAGWFAPDAADPWNFATDTVTGNITLTARWEGNLPLAASDDVAAAVTHANANPGTFTLLIGTDVTVDAVQAIGAGVYLTVAGHGGR